jgi:hypothetical protein
LKPAAAPTWLHSPFNHQIIQMTVLLIRRFADLPIWGLKPAAAATWLHGPSIIESINHQIIK